MNPSPAHLTLAPMQGLVDDIMRDVLTRIGGFDACVTEFVRITHTLHSRPVWHRYMPELNHGGQTGAGVPVTLQLLGSDEASMARNAQQAFACGAQRIDLNFGCPAPTVNKHAGGAVLLKEPRRIEAIVAAVRRALPAEATLSAKMRLGYADTGLALDCARAIEAGGAQSLTVHARTKVQGYTPPADWDWLARIAAAVSLPLTANGDVFSVADYRAIRRISGCQRVMLGRGAVMVPDLARQIAADAAGRPVTPLAWPQLLPWLLLFLDLCCAKAGGKYPVARLKQWLGMLKQAYPQAADLFARIRVLTEPAAVRAVLRADADAAGVAA